MKMNIVNAKSNVELKAIKKFKGHEGETCYQGNIYCFGKKVGFFSDDTWGGSTTYNFINEEKEEEVKREMIVFLTTVGLFNPRKDGKPVKVDERIEFLSITMGINGFVKQLQEYQRNHIKYFKQSAIEDGIKFEGKLKQQAIDLAHEITLAFEMTTKDMFGYTKCDFKVDNYKFCYSEKDLKVFSKTVPNDKRTVFVNRAGELFIVA